MKKYLLLASSFLVIASCGSGSGSGGSSCAPNCPAASLVEISWDANHDLDLVTSYSIRMGTDPDAVNTEVKVVNITDAGFSPEMPSAAIDIRNSNLNISAGDNVCFQVYAHNKVGASPPSLLSCITIN